MFARPACGLQSPLAATASGQVLSPGFSTRLPGLQITRRHQGFIHIRPSSLPLAGSLPRTERGPLGFFPELRTPTGRTRRRTSGRGSVTNTNRELRDRHCRPPIHELTHIRDIASHPQVLIIAQHSRPAHSCCFSWIGGVDLRYGSTADQGRTGREVSSSRLWHPARALGTHAKRGPSTGRSAVGLRQGGQMSL